MKQSQQQYEFSAQPRTVGKPKYRGSLIASDNHLSNRNSQMDQDNIVPPDLEEYIEQPLDDEPTLKPDYYVDRPPTPEYKPIEKGIDVQTQIEQDELFDFRMEVRPILQVLIGKNIVQARMELILEDEQKELRDQKESFDMKRNAELMVAQRMEQAYIRRKEEKERRNLQHAINNQQMKLTKEKLSSRMLTKQHMRNIKSSVLDDLKNLGYLRDDKYLLIKKWTINQMFNKIFEKNKKKNDFDDQLHEVIAKFEHQPQVEHKHYFKIEMDRRQAIIDERNRIQKENEERKLRKIEIKRRRKIVKEREVIKAQIEQMLNIHETLPFDLSIQVGDIAVQSTGGFIAQVPGDFLTQLWVVYDMVVNNQSAALDYQTNQELWLDLLINQLKTPLVINLNSYWQHPLEINIQQLEEDPEEYLKNTKDTFIDEMLASIITSSDTRLLSSDFVQDYLEAGGREETLKMILKPLFDIYIKSINYKEKEKIIKKEKIPDPQPEKHVDPVENIEENPAEQPVEPQEPPQPQFEEEVVLYKPEVTEMDLQMMEAKKRIQIVYDQSNIHQNLKSINRIHLPFEIPEPPPEEENKSLVENQSQGNQQDLEKKISQKTIPPMEEQPKVGKWDFDPTTIDIFDGKGYHPDESIPRQLIGNTLYGYPLHMFNGTLLTVDSRALKVVRMIIYEVESFINVPSFEDIEIASKNLDLKANHRLEEFYASVGESIPIFDFEI